MTSPDLTAFAFTRRTWVDAPPAAVYDLVADVSAIERWSPSASAVAYDPGDGPRVGARFGGRNRRGDKEWTTRSQVVEADPGVAFAFVVDGIVSWRWTFRPDGDGTVVGQSWELLRHDPVLGEDLAGLRDHMADSVETTLVALARWITAEKDARVGATAT